ncbi:hypothetical protein TNCV_1151001 [Trichonephila clavipes]|nr:hypothetical protein TNCV_1151001 [Trichonephila clavipes]
MNPETFQAKFMKHQRIPDRSWRDLCLKLRVTLKNVSDGMEERDFQIIEEFNNQISSKSRAEIRERFCDEWAKWRTICIGRQIGRLRKCSVECQETNQPEMSPAIRQRFTI